MKNIYLLALYLLFTACSDNSVEPIPDISDSVTGKYLFEYQETLLGATSKYSLEWTIKKRSSDKVTITHSFKETVVSAPDGYEPYEPFSTTLDDVDVTSNGKFSFERNMNNWIDGDEGKTVWKAAGTVSGDLNVDLSLTDLSDNEIMREQILMKRQ